MNEALYTAYRQICDSSWWAWSNAWQPLDTCAGTLFGCTLAVTVLWWQHCEHCQLNSVCLTHLCVRWMTVIRLPLKSEMKQLAASRTLAARFRDIQPSLLLFLHRLRSITIYNQVQYVSDLLFFSYQPCKYIKLQLFIAFICFCETFSIQS